MLIHAYTQQGFGHFMVFIKILTLLIYALGAEEEETGLPQLITKQDINNIRFISDDGRFTYYQRRSGDLLLSTNYSVDAIVQNPPNTQYRVHAPHDTNNIVIEAKSNYHSNLNLRASNQIYTSTRGSKNSNKVGEGQNVQLHFGGSWYSFYSASERKIFFQNFSSNALRFNIEMQNRINPYFIPRVEMLNDSTVVYTDIGTRGNQAVIKLNRGNNEAEVLLQASSPNQQIDICLLNNQLIIQEIGTMDSNNGSLIHRIPTNNLSIDNSETFYQSRHNDLGSLTCDQEGDLVYFVINTQEKTGRRTSEVAKINPLNGEVSIETQLNFVTQLIQMDKSLLIPLRDEVYVLKGQSDFTSFDLLQRGILENE